MLPVWIEELEITSVLDAGCGDGQWFPSLDVPYVGVDISTLALDGARVHYPERPYLLADFCTDELPRADAVICRDALQHLSYTDVRLALRNFRRSGARWLFANTHRGGPNRNVRSGGWFPIDLEVAPFNLGPPARELPDGMWATGNRYPAKVFGAWML